MIQDEKADNMPSIKPKAKKVRRWWAIRNRSGELVVIYGIGMKLYETREEVAKIIKLYGKLFKNDRWKPVEVTLKIKRSGVH